jgi:hypothetical protein
MAGRDGVAAGPDREQSHKRGPMSSAAAGPEPESVRREQAAPLLMIATVVVGVAVAAIAIAALVLLSGRDRHDQWTPVLQDVLKTAYQALIVGALGGLAKLLIDRRKERDQSAAEVRARRHWYISRVVDANHMVDNARVLILANRSVRTWTDSVTGAIVPARTSLRSVANDLTNWTSAGQPVFRQDEPSGNGSHSLSDDLQAMCDYLLDLIDEHANHKQRLAEMQNSAEKMEGPDRQAQLERIWEGLRALPHLHDFVDEDLEFASYKADYFNALIAMRSSLTPRRSPNR